LIEKNKLKWIYILCGIFTLLNGILVANEFYWLSLLPFLIVIVLLYLYSLDKLILLLVFFTPLSINFTNVFAGMGLSLPTEPLMLGLLFIFIFKILTDKNYDKSFLNHIISKAILIYLFWILITVFTSSLPIVSLKFLLARLWFISSVFFLGVPLFKEKKNFGRFMWMYIFAFIVVIFYTIYNHSLHGFSEHTGHWVMSPFYNDHTAYGALLAFFIPVVVYFTFGKRYKFSIKIISFFILVLFFIAFLLSYCRAAWLSLIIGFLVWMIIVFRIKIKWLFLVLLLIAGIFYAFKDPILYKLEKNKQDSSTDILKHVQSVSNISSDASNLERINRWNSAFKMFYERPVFGWGPGTYQFIYGPYQSSKDKTIISTNVGDKGNAHSEYIGPLAESGILGALTFILILITAIYTAIKIYHKSNDRKIKGLILAIITSLTTYIIHGSLNNFLDTDKAAIPFWGFIAMIVAIDLYHTNKEEIKS